MKKKRKLLTALLLVLIFSLSLMPMAFADDEAAPVEVEASAPATEAAAIVTEVTPAETATEVSSENSQAEPADQAATKDAAVESEENETTPSAEITGTSETAETAPAEEVFEEEVAEANSASLYTVEFVNPENGSEVKIVGGSDIYFTVLNQELGLGVNVEEVVSIDSSNDELFKAQEVDGDYVIHTFRPFSTQEQLLIKLINSGEVSVDVFDGDDSGDAGFQAIAASFDNGYSYNGTKMPTKANVIKIEYLGTTWDVIGYNGSGIGAGAGQMMLLLDGVAGSTSFSSSNNVYSGSALETAMGNYLNEITSNPDDADMVALLTDMTLNGGKSYVFRQDCDGVAGSSVTSKIRPLTTKEAKILSNGNTMSLSQWISYNNYNWWLASPGANRNVANDGYADAVTSSGGTAGGYSVGNSLYLRPAVLLTLPSGITTEEISTGLYKLVLPEPEPTPTTGDAAVVYVRGLVYVDGKLITEGTDYNWVDGKLVLTDEFIKTLSEGTHKIAVLYTSIYGDALPSDFEYTAANSYDFTV